MVPPSVKLLFIVKLPETTTSRKWQPKPDIKGGEVPLYLKLAEIALVLTSHFLWTINSWGFFSHESNTKCSHFLFTSLEYSSLFLTNIIWKEKKVQYSWARAVIKGELLLSITKKLLPVIDNTLRRNWQLILGSVWYCQFS